MWATHTTGPAAHLAFGQQIWQDGVVEEVLLWSWHADERGLPRDAMAADDAGNAKGVDHAAMLG